MQLIFRLLRRLMPVTALNWAWTFSRIKQASHVDAGTQILLMEHYKKMAREGTLPSIKEVGFREYSGSDEDGILLYIYALISSTNRTFVDIGAGGIQGSNVANLIINHGWTGLLIDANQEMLTSSHRYYSKLPSVGLHPPQTACTFVNTDMINDFIQENGISGEIDLLSVDIDGIDYWLWEAIECINPRVVIVEYQPALGAGKALTTPNLDTFSRNNYSINTKEQDFVYTGASLDAFVKLGRKKNYRLVGSNLHDVNAFFVRNDVGTEHLPEIDSEACFEHPRVQRLIDTYMPELLDMDWVEV